jgi:adenosylcobinamide-GDP ribazoletransferase
VRRAPAHPVAEPLGDVRAAAGFLTRLPVGAARRDAVGARAFGVVGAGIGLLAAVPLVLLGPPVPLVAAVLAVSVIVVVTGAVHIDGLADTADALAAPSPDAAERARNDPRLGSGGVATMTLALALGIACLATLAAQDPALAAAAVVVAATVSRSAAPVAALAWSKWGSAATSERGAAGAWFVRLVGPPETAAVLATSLVAVAVGTALAGPAIALGSALGVSAGGVIAAWVLLRRGQLDGDGYGAVIELVFVAMLSGIAVAGSLR